MAEIYEESIVAALASLTVVKRVIEALVKANALSADQMSEALAAAHKDLDSSSFGVHQAAARLVTTIPAFGERKLGR